MPRNVKFVRGNFLSAIVKESKNDVYISQGIAIPIPIMTIGMRLPHDRINGKRVAASKPQALVMVTK